MPRQFSNSFGQIEHCDGHFSPVFISQYYFQEVAPRGLSPDDPTILHT